MRLLCISNGHGEDAIAIQVLTALQSLAPAIVIAALPMVGNGDAYRRAGIEIVGPTQTMPSGGFIYMDSQQLVRDLQGGLLPLAWAQWQAVRRWVKVAQSEPVNGQGRAWAGILAVGDIVPLLLGWLSGLPYGFIGTAKSDYYLKNKTESHELTVGSKPLTRKLPSFYHPWERWLMQQPRCRCVFPRDTLTTRRLQQWPIPAWDAGNPMMDGFTLAPFTPPVPSDPLSILLLPGSRVPEAYENWHRILQAVASVQRQWADQPLLFLAAIAPSLQATVLDQVLKQQGWQGVDTSSPYQRGQAQLQVSKTAFVAYAEQAAVAIAMAGTATEQFVGLGKPAITLPGSGPQFTPQFAELQTRLLGPSAILVKDPDTVGQTLQALLKDPTQLQQIYTNGQQRLGSPGASQRIAQHLCQTFLTSNA